MPRQKCRTGKAIAQGVQGQMVTFLITSFLLLAAISYAIYCWQRVSSNKGAEHVLPPPRFGGLFGSEDSADASPVQIGSIETDVISAQQRAALTARATQGVKEALWDAHTSGDTALYDEVLNALVEQARGSHKRLLALVSHIARSDRLRVNVKLAEAIIEAWKNSPDKGSTAKMLHIAALADDATIYQRAIELALQVWREGRLPDLSAEEFRVLAEGEFWVLSQSTRSSGAGFIVKRKLAALRRELQTAKRV